MPAAPPAARIPVDGPLPVSSTAGYGPGSILVLAPAEGWPGLLPGQRARVTGRLLPPMSGDLLVAVLSADEPPVLLGRPPPWQRLAGAVRAGLRRACAGLPSLPGGLLPGMVDGDTSRLDPVLADRFRVAGLTHLAAVSGTNCAILVGSVALLLGRLRASPRTIALVGLGVLVAVRADRPAVAQRAAGGADGGHRPARPGQRPATQRVAGAGGELPAAARLAAELGRRTSASRCRWRPPRRCCCWHPGCCGGCAARGVPGGLAEPVAVAAAAHLVTMPLIAGVSGRISLVAIPANLLAEPVVAAVTILGVLAAVASVLWLPAGAAFAQLAGWPCRWLVWVGDYFGSLPGGSVPWPAGLVGGLLLAGVVLAGGWLCRRPAVRGLLATAIVVALLVQIPVRVADDRTGHPLGWLIVACSVGQGDSLALECR